MSDTSDQLAIRTASPADASRIAILITQLGYPASPADISDRLAYWQADPMSLVLVAESAGRVIGCLSLHAIPYLERTGRWARIESLVIDEAGRGNGTGRALVAAAEKAARRWNCLAVEVTSSRARVDAHAFYQRIGYADICDQSGRFLKALRGGAGDHLGTVRYAHDHTTGT
jgi:GNAT superfamily N-acetyltransferase